MKKKKLYKCKICGKTYEGFRVSGTCSIDCGTYSMIEVVKSLHEKKGKYWRKWEENWARGVKRYIDSEIKKL